MLAKGGLDIMELPPPPPDKGSTPPRSQPTTRHGEPVEGIVFAEPDYIIPPPEPIPEPGVEVTSVEPKVYDPEADLRPFQWALDAINANAAWATGYTGDGVIVAVLDTGIDSTHPDLVGQVIRRYDSWTGWEEDPTLNFDTHGHGTHCAGIIAAKNDGKGVVGLAYNAQLFDVRIFYPGFVGTIPCLLAVKWAVDKGADILSNSWGGVMYSQAIKAAMDYALARNVVVVAAAGNTTYHLWFRPASIPGVIGVAASNPHNKKTTWSTPGPWVAVAAPGDRVLSSVRTQITQPGTGRPLYYDYWSGTSMSCPYVSALAAMILEKYPAATPYQVKKLIERTAKDIEAPAFDPGTGYGLIQADRALTTALPPNDGAALRIHVVTKSSMPLWGEWWPVTFMDVTLRKDGRVVALGQTDLDGWLVIGFPMGDYWGGWGLGYFPILEPGTYEVVVGGDDQTLWWDRTANRVTARTTVTLTAGGTHTVDVQVNTTLEVTLSWTGGGSATDIDLAVWEPGVGWTFAWWPGLWGTWTADQMGPSGTETYTLIDPHYDDYLYGLAVVLWGGPPPTVTVTVRQNTVVETYTFTLTAPGVYYADQWPNWWSWWPGPWVF